ncbi:glycerate kinase type-2 family protein [Celeribacter litoreus]|uniref:glycerate kinase type-2 family protein n=1 Tax=Celeribacter litoreus TaxID=2876714 RepID=UPI001CCB6161|nr:DUF4147 domain-containing protein [Celeribacter litoreus]MCA0044534.1 DUF4147 domain-containing protein [Celeribacter litoreus]
MIQNTSPSSAPFETMRQQARDIFLKGVEAADPERAVEAALEGKRFHDPVLISVGKAACAMAEAAMRHVSADPVIVVTNYENARPIEGAEVRAAGHPVPDAEGARAALTIEGILSHAKGDVIALISGGGSALLPAPVPGVSLEDKAEVNRLLLASGADIVTMNLVRQQLSRLKGGGLLRAAAPAKVTALLLSDVVSDDLRAIASGPTVSPIGTREDAAKVLQDLGVWDKLPHSVTAHLSRPQADLGPLPESEVELIGSNKLSVSAMAEAAPEAVVAGEPLEGDVAEAAEAVIAAAKEPGIYLFGGETTVKLEGDGMGGRNQELALRVALLAEQAGITDYVFLSGGTDGRDGPTDAAGGLVDPGTLDRMRSVGLSPEEVLKRNDSYHGLQAAGDLLQIGATGTNVADLQVMIRR